MPHRGTGRRSTTLNGAGPGADADPHTRDGRAPLPRITGLTPEERLALEMELVDRSIVYARDHLGLG